MSRAESSQTRAGGQGQNFCGQTEEMGAQEVQRDGDAAPDGLLFAGAEDWQGREGPQSAEEGAPLVHVGGLSWAE